MKTIVMLLACALPLAAQLPDDERSRLASRLELGRQLIGDIDPLRRFFNWKSPKERLQNGIQSPSGNADAD